MEYALGWHGMYGAGFVHMQVHTSLNYIHFTFSTADKENIPVSFSCPYHEREKRKKSGVL